MLEERIRRGEEETLIKEKEVGNLKVPVHYQQTMPI